MHRARDLVGAENRLAGPIPLVDTPPVNEPQKNRDKDSDPRPGEHALHRIADREAGDEPGEDGDGEEASSGADVGTLHRRAMPEPPRLGQPAALATS